MSTPHLVYTLGRPARRLRDGNLAQHVPGLGWAVFDPYDDFRWTGSLLTQAQLLTAGVPNN